MVRSGRLELAGAIPAAELTEAATRVDNEALVAFINLLERIAEGLRANAAARLALERAMLAWPSTAPMTR
jgi:hypothetical protein